MFCPNLDNVYYKGNPETSIQSSYLSLEIEKCKNDPKTNKKCAPEREINEFINRIFVLSFLSIEKIDF